MTETAFHSGFVAVVGKPNVGKSTLINALMGQPITAVSPRPQTTRRQQLGILTDEDTQIIFTDTPGVHHPKHKLGDYMNEEAVLALEDSDVVLFIVDGSEEPEEEDELLAGIIKDALKHTPVILALNKTEMLQGEALELAQEVYARLAPQADVIAISALAGLNLDILLEKLKSNLPEHPPFYSPEQITDLYEREIAADLIRAAALIILRDEVPHAIAVRIDEYTERGDTGAYIEATLFVERESQKGIVVGKGGVMIKKISTMARKSIEEMSGRKVYLRLRVKVRKNWRNDENALGLFGFRGSGKGLN
jgi:GTP-binding protein Era